MELPNSSIADDVGDIFGATTGDEWAVKSLFPKLVTHEKPSNAELENPSSDGFQCRLGEAIKIVVKKQEQKL